MGKNLNRPISQSFVLMAGSKDGPHGGGMGMSRYTLIKSSEVKRDNQGRSARPQELERSANVVKATSAAHRTQVHDADRWFYELDWMIDGVRE